MKKVGLILGAVLITAIMLTSCGAIVLEEEAEEPKEITIGTQVWMTKNLNVDKFRNGDSIPQAKTPEEWKKAGNKGQPAWCYYDNDPANAEKYGKLYNWYAVSDPRGIAPIGFHIPRNAEWIILEYYLGLDGGFSGLPVGFAALPGGLRLYDGTFSAIGKYGTWWSSPEFDSNEAWVRYLYYENGTITTSNEDKASGFSVRCLRD